MRVLLADDYQTTLTQLEASLQVQHVAHRPLTTVSASAAMGQAQAIAASQTLNNLPVVDNSDGIVGVLENLNGEIKGYPVPRVDVSGAGHAMRPLASRMLVECQCSLEDLLNDLVVPPYYQLVVTAGQIDGIVTVADLNKAPVRVMSYATVAHLEMAMATAIRCRTNDDDKAAVAMLGPDSAAQVSDAHRRLREGYLNADLLDATTFKQKGIILTELGVFAQTQGTTVKSEFERLYRRLRNPLMHMSPFVADSIEGLRDFVADLEQARRRAREAVAAAG